MAKFLSHDWMEAVRVIRDEHGSAAGAVPHSVRMNLVITDCPDDVGDDGIVHAHMDSTSGEMKMEQGHLENPELTVTVPYDDAKAIFVDQNPQAGMQAFMAGRVKVQGDMTKLMAMQSAAPSAEAQELANKIKEVTE